MGYSILGTASFDECKFYTLNNLILIPDDDFDTATVIQQYLEWSNWQYLSVTSSLLAALAPTLACLYGDPALGMSRRRVR